MQQCKTVQTFFKLNIHFYCLKSAGCTGSFFPQCGMENAFVKYISSNEAVSDKTKTISNRFKRHMLKVKSKFSEILILPINTNR